MDTPQPESLMRDDLEFIGWLNQRFGSHRQIRRFLQDHIPSDKTHPLEILDCATGYGDIPRLVSGELQSRRIPHQITATDVNPLTLKIAREATQDGGIRFRMEDIFQLPFENDSFDWVFCHMALHHFSIEEAVKAVREMWRVCRGILFCTDILRCDEGLLSAFLVSRLTRNPVSRHDAVLSIRRAFDPEEFRGIFQQAGIGTGLYHRALFFRQGMICPKDRRE